MKRIQLILFVVCFYALLSGSLTQGTYAQAAPSAPVSDMPVQTIRGKVTDAATGHPLPYVAITIENIPGRGTVSDNEGDFELKSIPVGRHTVTAAYVGYDPAVLREILVTSAKEVYLEIAMIERAETIGDVVVRPKVNKQEALNPMSLAGGRMLSVEEASRYAGGMDDPARLVGSFAGVSPSVGNNGISIHGNAPHLLQWKLEDVEIPNPNHYADLSVLGGGILSSLSSNVLGNSDFFTGAFPAEYGNAVSGVFDMKLRNGNNRSHEHTIQLGVLGLDLASEGPLGKESDASYIFNYRYSTLGLVDKLGVAGDLGGSFDYQDLNFKFNMPTSGAGTFTVWGTGLIDKYKEDPASPKDRKYNFDICSTRATQYLGAAGVSNRYLFRNNSTLKTSLAITYFSHEGTMDSHQEQSEVKRYLDMDRRSTNLIFTTAYTRKFGARHTNKTGFTYTRMFYDMNMDQAPYIGYDMQKISEGDGSTGLLSVYSMSAVNLGSRVTVNGGLYGQLLTLNNSKSIEPRLSFRWKAGARTTLSLAYGLHSRMEKMDVYFVRSEDSRKPVNKNLGFTKAHHWMISYGYAISDRMNLRIEPYYQYLFNVPVVDGTSESVLNRDEFYVEDKLVNKGSGRNYGVDITLERYLDRGYYFMSTVSLFNSEYRGGDGVWRNTRYNRRYIANVLGGKEWMLGRGEKNMLSVNAKLTLQGGERYTPADPDATLLEPDLTVVLDESRAYTKSVSPVFVTNLSASYTLNRKKVSHEFAIKVLNLTGAKDFLGQYYNLKTDRIDKEYGRTCIPNLSYKVHF